MSAQELSMQASASQRAWLKRNDKGSGDTHTQDLHLLKKSLVGLSRRDNSRQVAKI